MNFYTAFLVVVMCGLLLWMCAEVIITILSEDSL